MTVRKIISGGQTGVDRAALDWAIREGIPCGGWCPKGRRAEDGPIPLIYPLQETPTHSYRQRTDGNARDSDATVLLTISPELTDGTLLTALRVSAHHRPWLHLSSEAFGGDAVRAAGFLVDFLARYGVETLNVAGPRASKEPAVGDWVIAVLDAVCETGKVFHVKH